ncbi:MAG TPA: hypothetical protein PLM16_01485, partial [Candidatus Woesebacteria bacterium]|nr:hypothetical protein [Candidatus Woesebacteria bacterium]
EASKQYLLEASGVYQYSSNSSHQADAAYGTLNNFSTTRNDIGLWGTSRGVTSIIGDLGEGMGVIVWDDNELVNQDHHYRFLLKPSAPILASFVISDWYDQWYNANPSCNNQGCMSDNSGSLELTIYECVSSQITPTPTPTD